MNADFGSLIVELGAHRAQAGLVDLVRLAVSGADQALAPQPLKDKEGAVRQKKTFAGVTIDGSNAAGCIAPVHDAAALGENV